MRAGGPGPSEVVAVNRADAILSWAKGPAVLDVGCAAGVHADGPARWLHARLLQSFPRVVGIDVDRGSIDELQARGYRDLHVADAQTFRIAEAFDTVVAGEVIEHLSNPGAFLERAAAHLAPDGRLIVTTPFPFSLMNTLYALVKFPRTCSNAEHTCWFCPRTLSELVRRHGLRTVHWELVEDYRRGVPSAGYRLGVAFLSAFRWCLPKTLRCNSMLFVLERTRKRGDPTPRLREEKPDAKIRGKVSFQGRHV